MHTGCERRRRVKFFAQLSRKKAGRGAGARWAPSSAWSPLPRRSVLDVCHWQTSPEPAGESGLALARTERASCQRPPRMGCVEALAGCPLSRLTATAPPKGEPSMCATKSLRKAKSRLPLWGALVPSGHRSALDRAGRREWTRVSEDGEGKLPASPSAPVAIALTGASAPVAGSFLAARP